ncbi:MAG: hypothetical protein IIZ33_02895 [Erysipelotrichaceae bacterium]|nr:hypothetical protein [Erysipelotrichaceae bacterium]
MKDFEGKIIRIYFHATQGSLVCNGYYLKKEGTFLVIRDTLSKKLKYVNEQYIRTIEIVGDADED